MNIIKHSGARRAFAVFLALCFALVCLAPMGMASYAGEDTAPIEDAAPAIQESEASAAEVQTLGSEDEAIEPLAITLGILTLSDAPVGLVYEPFVRNVQPEVQPTLDLNTLTLTAKSITNSAYDLTGKTVSWQVLPDSSASTAPTALNPDILIIKSGGQIFVRAIVEGVASNVLSIPVANNMATDTLTIKVNGEQPIVATVEELNDLDSADFRAYTAQAHDGSPDFYSGFGPTLEDIIENIAGVDLDDVAGVSFEAADGYKTRFADAKGGLFNTRYAYIDGTAEGTAVEVVPMLATAAAHTGEIAADTLDLLDNSQTLRLYIGQSNFANHQTGSLAYWVNTMTLAEAPEVTVWPTATAINFGQQLQTSALEGGTASVEGTFAFTSRTTVPSAVGVYEAGVTFTPASWSTVGDYAPVTGTVNVTVNPVGAAALTLADAPDDLVYTPRISSLSWVENKPSFDLNDLTLTAIDAETEEYDLTEKAITYEVVPADSSLSFTREGDVLTFGSGGAWFITAKLEGVTSNTLRLAVRNAAATDELKIIVDGDVEGAVTVTADQLDDLSSAAFAAYSSQAHDGSPDFYAGFGPTLEEIFSTYASVSKGTAPGNIKSVVFTATDNYKTSFADANATLFNARYRYEETSGYYADYSGGDPVAYSDDASVVPVAPRLVTSAGHSATVGGITLDQLYNSQSLRLYIGQSTYSNHQTGSLSYWVKQVEITTFKQDPGVTSWPTATGIKLGQKLSDSELAGGTSTKEGTFAFTSPATVPTVLGPYAASVTFTPDDTAYDSVTGTVTVNVTGPTIELKDFGTKVVNLSEIIAHAVTPPTGDVAITNVASASTATATVALTSSTSVTVTGLRADYSTRLTFTITDSAEEPVTQTITAFVNVTGVYDVDEFEVTGVEDRYIYAGSPITPTVILTKKNALTLGTDYTVSYSNNNAQGTASALITGIGTYTGTKTVNFEIVSPALYLTGYKAWDAFIQPDDTEITSTLDPSDLLGDNDAGGGGETQYLALRFNKAIKIDDAEALAGALSISFASANKNVTYSIDSGDAKTLIVQMRDKPGVTTAQAGSGLTVTAKALDRVIAGLVSDDVDEYPAYLTYNISTTQPTGISFQKIAKTTGNATTPDSVTYKMTGIPLVRSMNFLRFTDGNTVISDLTIHSHTFYTMPAATHLATIGSAGNISAFDAKGYVLSVNTAAGTLTIAEKEPNATADNIELSLNTYPAKAAADRKYELAKLFDAKTGLTTPEKTALDNLLKDPQATATEIAAKIVALGGGADPSQTISSVKVTFNANGGAVSEPARYIPAWGAIGTLPVPTRTDYVFDGWYTEQASGVKITAAATANAAVTYYAHWSAIHTVTFHPNTGTVSEASRKVTNGTAVGTLPTPTKAGHVFNGWFTAPSGGQKISAATVITDSVTHYAQWTAQHTVIFNAYGGSKAASKTVLAGTAIGKLPETTQTGYTFLGWYTAKTGGTKISESTKISQNVTYHAQWKINQYKATFNANKGKASKTSIKKNYNSKLGTLPKATRAGYKFQGWYTAKTGGQKITASTKITKNVTYYAHWTKK
ncbi:MAG: InlB B-repeat-containing protein [Clostridiales Family XIII bacterium]|jgi:uncharacterized repeat protein (TIGR02543 family)|nr:InlB B-repeat-containing protein [Clostridiales Family XIII bacterium]